jgi:TP901 family phage tail tape measure protein
MAQQDLRVNIKGNASGLTTALNTASGKMKSFGSKMSSIGSSLQSRLALPLVAIGGAAIKMAFDFDKSLTQIKSLVGVAGDEVDAMGRKARQMALDWGISSAEAADALFYITSAGLRGEEAMQVLEASLKAAAVGLGETKTIADLATSAMNGYGSDTLSASDATDILTAAVREGKLEASALAESMGGVIPIASNLGVGFEEVAAALAAMSRTGTKAADGATQLNAILSSIVKPTDQSVLAFEKMGLSTEDLSKSLSDDGLLNTLVLLKDGLERTGQSFTDIVPNIRAWKGVLDLTGAGLEVNKKIFDALNNAMGATNDSSKILAQSLSFKMTVALNRAKESLASLGSKLLVEVVPILEKAANFVSNLYRAFSGLEGSTQKLIIGIGLFGAVLPTIITLAGTLTTIIGALLSPIGLVVAALAAIAYVIYKNWNEVLPVITGFYNQFVDLYNSSNILRVAIWAVGSAFKAVFIGAKAWISHVNNVIATAWKLIQGMSEDAPLEVLQWIIEDGIGKSVDIGAKAAEEMATTFTDDFADALNDTLEHKTAEQIQTGLSNAVDGAVGFIKGLGAKVGDWFSGGMFAGGGGGGGNTEEGTTPASPITAVLAEQKQELTEWQKWALANAQAFNDQISGIMQNAVGGMISGMASAMGTAIATGGNLAGALGETILGAIATLLVQLGEAAIAIGLAMIKIQMAFTNPYTAIAAGIALVAMGSAIGALIPSILGQDKGDDQQVSIPEFANGGLVFGPTMGLMGEYPGARSNPEVIAPLNKLESMLGGRGATNVNVGGEFVMRGSDLVVVLDRANKNRSRLI